MFRISIQNGVFLAVVATVLTASPPAFSAWVDLVIGGTASSPVLEIDDASDKCDNDKHCLQTQRGQSMDIDFRLKGACKEGGPAYRLSGMQLSMIQSQPDGAGGMRKAFGYYVMPAIVTQDFDTQADGTLNFGNPGSNSLKDDKINVKNKNKGIYTVFYQITATKCPDIDHSGPETIYLDPRIKNTGQ